MNIKQTIKSNWIWIVISLIASAGAAYLMSIIAAGEHLNFGILSTVVVLLIFFEQFLFVKDIKKALDKKRIIYSAIMSFLLALSYVIGYQMKSFGETSCGVKGKLLILVCSAMLSFVFLPLFYWLIERGVAFTTKNNDSESKLTLKEKGKVFGISFGVIFACWMPVFLAYYPAIMSYDFHRQCGEARRGFIWFTTHHPLIHTTLIRVFLNLGEKIGSYELGMAAFSLMQMGILALTLAYSCNMIARFTNKRRYAYIVAAIFGLLPIHPVLAMSMTKDILFSAFFLLFVLLVIELNNKTVLWHKLAICAAIVVVGVLTMILRNNALYAFYVFLPVFVVLGGKKWYRNLIMAALIVAISLFTLSTMQKQMNAIKGSKVEMFSVVIQQFGRTGKNHIEELTPEDYATINRYVGAGCWDGYYPPLADSIKGGVAVYDFPNWENDIPGMLKDWFRIGTHYPNDYFDAFFALTSGYWFMDDESHADCLGTDENMGLLYTFNASKNDVFDGVRNIELIPGIHSLYSKIINQNKYMNVPIVSILFKPAFYCWLLIFSFVMGLYLKKKKNVLITLWPILYLMTLFLGPVVNFRYVYPMVVVVPLLLFYLNHKESK